MQPISFHKALSKKLPRRSLPHADVAVAVRGVTVDASHPHHLPTRSTDGFRGGWSVCSIPDVTVVFVFSSVAVVFSPVAVVYAGFVGRVNLDLLFADLDCLWVLVCSFWFKLCCSCRG